MKDAQKHKAEAKKVLMQAHAAGEQWAMPTRNPAKGKTSSKRKTSYLLHVASVPNYDIVDRGGAYEGYWQGGYPVEDRWVPVGSIQEAQQYVELIIRRHELGGGNWAGGEVVDRKTHKAVGQISYNGRFWPAEEAKQNPSVKPPKVPVGGMVKIQFPSGNFGIYRANKSKPDTMLSMVKLWDHIASTSVMKDGKRKWFLVDRGTFRPAAKASAAEFDKMPVSATYAELTASGRARRNPKFENKFDEFDWQVIAALLNADLVKLKKLEQADRTSKLSSVDIRFLKGTHAGRTLRITDNGGEVNLNWWGPKGDEGSVIEGSVEYTSNADYVGDVTLAYRIETTLRGEEIDYGLYLDGDQPRRVDLKTRKLQVLPGGKPSVPESKKRVRVSRIALMFAEGPSSMEGTTEVIVPNPGVNVWEKADQVLGEWSRQIVPATSTGQWKQDFVITWIDGEKYFGTYGLSKQDKVKGDLSAHVVDFVSFHAGMNKPEDMSQESYRELLGRAPKAVESARKLIEQYDLGPSTPKFTAQPAEKSPAGKGKGRRR